MNEYTVGTEIMFLDDNKSRFGVIEYINENKVHICELDGSLFITNIQSILYLLTTEGLLC
jgi:hypothetical protein